MLGRHALLQASLVPPTGGRRIHQQPPNAKAVLNLYDAEDRCGDVLGEAFLRTRGNRARKHDFAATNGDFDIGGVERSVCCEALAHLFAYPLVATAVASGPAATNGPGAQGGGSEE